MTYNLITNKFNLITSDDINPINDSSNNAIYISKTLYTYLTSLKEEIDLYNCEWDNIKRYINPFEFIHTKVPSEKLSVCKYVPISRSFFKLTEIFNCFSINKYFHNNVNHNSLHLAEAPGGFIEASLKFSDTHKIKFENMIGISLLDNNMNTPQWSNNYFDNYSNVFLEKNHQNNCDITKANTFNYFTNKYKYYFSLITADGGFDFSADFNNQEKLSQPLILSEILYAIAFQKPGGIFILKMFDCFTLLSVQYLFLLSSFYEKLYIYKPNTSRLANSEKYIICINYINTEYNRNNFIKKIPYILNKSNNINSILDNSIPLFFYQKLEEINAILGQQQLEGISSTLSLITHKSQKDKLSNLKETNVQKCIAWCNKHNFSYNNF